MVKTGCSFFVLVIILCNFELQIGCKTFFSQIKLGFSIYSYFVTHFIDPTVDSEQLKGVNLLAGLIKRVSV